MVQIISFIMKHTLAPHYPPASAILGSSYCSAAWESMISCSPARFANSARPNPDYSPGLAGMVQTLIGHRIRLRDQNPFDVGAHARQG